MYTSEVLVAQGGKYWGYGAGETVTIEPPRGVDRLPDEWRIKLGEHQLDEPWMVELDDVDLCGQALVGIWRRDIVLDTAYFGRIDLWERNKPYWDWALEAMKIPPKKIELATSFTGVWSDNYFHWVLDYLPRLKAIDEYKKQTGEEPTILLHRPLDYMVETLDQLGYKYEVVEGYHYRVNRLLVISNPRKEGLIYPWAIKYLQSKLGESVHAPRKIYISRKNATKRRVLNEDDYIPGLLNKGYTIATPEKMGIKGQADYFRDAEMVIGPHGAGLANIAWSLNPKTIELVTPAYTNPCCWMVAACMGWDYGFVMADATGKEDLIVDEYKLFRTMEMLS
jgi:hypothetical protein